MTAENPLVDVGYGKPIELSSTWGDYENTFQLLPVGHLWTPDYSFHTDLQSMPYLIVDLLSVRSIARIRIFNRESYPERAIPLAITVSSDREDWVEISRINHAFGGRKSDEPLELIFRQRIEARFCKFQVLNTTYFHLDYIEISAPLPVTRLGTFQSIDARAESIMVEYYHHYSYGFTWTFTATLMELISCRSHGAIVSRIDYSLCLIPFKDHPETDVYPVLFSPQPQSPAFESLAPVNFHHHGVYAKYDLGMLKKYATLYFWPSVEVLSFESELIKNYGLAPNNAIALVFRGTDKGSEVLPTAVERYIDVALAVLRVRPELQIIIQTDQQQALASVLDAIPNAIFFKELPVTSGTRVMHRHSLESEFNITKQDFAIQMLAVTHLLSSCRYVVTHTGNIGFWLACFRGNSDGFFQFDIETSLRGPNGDVIIDLESLNI